MLAGCYWFCILIWVSTYTANLAAFFTVKNVEQPIKDLEDALDSDYSIGVTMSSSNYAFFNSSKYELYQKAWLHMKAKKSFPNNISQGIEWARQKKYIHITDGPILKYAANKEPCDLMTRE